MPDPTISRRSLAAGLSGLTAAASLGSGRASAGTTAKGETLAAMTVPSIAALRSLASPVRSDPVTIFVQGYHSTDRPQGGGLFMWSPQSVLADDGGTVIRPVASGRESAGRWLRTGGDPANVCWFGAVGDGETDDTAAIQRAIDATRQDGMLVFPKGRYKVVTLDTGRCETTWRFDHAELIGGATEPTTCILRIRGLHSRFFDLRINAAFNSHYGCALWWYNDRDPSQHNDVVGLDIRYAKRGIVYGAMPGGRSTRFAQSENTIFGYHTRGVEKPLYINHDNGVLGLVSPHLVAHDEEWARDVPGRFDYTANQSFEAVAGVLVVQGGEVQNSIAATTATCATVEKGSEVHLDGCIVEVNTPFLIRGRLTIRGGRILNTQSMTSQFLVQGGEDSALHVSNCRLFRNPKVGSFSDRPLVVGQGDIVFDQCEITEWADFTPLVLGKNTDVHFERCRWRPQGPTGRDYRLDTGAPDLLDGRPIDHTGRSLDGFHPQGPANGSTGVSRDIPTPSYGGSIFIRADGFAGLSTLDTSSRETVRQSGIRMRGGERFLVEAWVRRVRGDVAVSMLVLDDAGNAISADKTGRYLVVCGNSQNFITDDWRYLRQVVTVPFQAAAYAGFGISTGASGGEVRMCGLKVRRADWSIG